MTGIVINFVCPFVKTIIIWKFATKLNNKVQMTVVSLNGRHDDILFYQGKVKNRLLIIHISCCDLIFIESDRIDMTKGPKSVVE